MIDRRQLLLLPALLLVPRPARNGIVFPRKGDSVKFAVIGGSASRRQYETGNSLPMPAAASLSSSS